MKKIILLLCVTLVFCGPALFADDGLFVGVSTSFMDPWLNLEGLLKVITFQTITPAELAEYLSEEAWQEIYLAAAVRYDLGIFQLQSRFSVPSGVMMILAEEPDALWFLWNAGAGLQFDLGPVGLGVTGGPLLLFLSGEPNFLFNLEANADLNIGNIKVSSYLGAKCPIGFEGASIFSNPLTEYWYPEVGVSLLYQFN